jgi:PncC family amidohydrolase
MRSELVDRVTNALRARGETVSFAESCTGGLLSSMVTSVAGVSDIFMGSVVAYSNDVKVSILGVPSRLLVSSGAVSAPCARAMARGGRTVFGTTWSVAITGIAGPGGGSVAKPVGTVFVGIAGPGVDRAVAMHFSGGRSVIQKASADSGELGFDDEKSELTV